MKSVVSLGVNTAVNGCACGAHVTVIDADALPRETGMGLPAEPLFMNCTEPAAGGDTVAIAVTVSEVPELAAQSPGPVSVVDVLVGGACVVVGSCAASDCAAACLAAAALVAAVLAAARVAAAVLVAAGLAAAGTGTAGLAGAG